MAISLTEIGIGIYSFFLTLIGGGYLRSQSDKLKEQDTRIKSKLGKELCDERCGNFKGNLEEIKSDVKSTKESIISINESIIKIESKLPNMNGK